jgi:hypothetical protein
VDEEHDEVEQRALLRIRVRLGGAERRRGVARARVNDQPEQHHGRSHRVERVIPAEMLSLHRPESYTRDRGSLYVPKFITAKLTRPSQRRSVGLNTLANGGAYGPRLNQPLP